MITSQYIRSLAKLASSQDASSLQEIDSLFNAKGYLLRSKQLAQLVARSWTNQPNGTDIREIFLNFIDADCTRTDSEAFNLHPSYKKMEDLLSGKLPYYNTPIFTPNELDQFIIEIAWDSFEGGIKDIPQGRPRIGNRFFILSIPYPPKPDAENLKLTDEKFLGWLNNESYDDLITDPFPPIPYVPSTSC
jgi:hypothetical protein